MILGNTNKSKIYHKTNSRKNFKRESMDFQKFLVLAKLSVPWPHSPWQSFDLWFLGHGVLSFSASLDTMSLRGLIYYHSLNLISMKITPTLLSISLNSLLRVVPHLHLLDDFSIPLFHLFLFSKSRSFSLTQQFNWFSIKHKRFM